MVTTERLCQCPFGLLFISTKASKKGKLFLKSVSMPIRASLHFHSTLLKAAEIKHFPDLFCRYLSENSESRNFQNHFCSVHNLFIFYSIAETVEAVSATLHSFKKVSNCCLLYYNFLFRKRTFCQISIIHSYPVSRFLLTSIPISTSRQSIPA